MRVAGGGWIVVPVLCLGSHGVDEPQVEDGRPVAALAGCSLTNADFETGDFTGWVTGGGSPIDHGWCIPGFIVDPCPTSLSLIEGSFSASHGVTQNVMGVADVLAQDVCLDACDRTLVFDWSATYTNSDFFGQPTGSFEFRVDIEPAGGGPHLQRDLVLSILPDDVDSDASVTTTTVDLSAFAGATVRISFEFETLILDDFTGDPLRPPFEFLLDDIRIEGAVASSAVRNGGGSNPTGFTESSPAIIGQDWITEVSLPPGATGSTIQISLGGPFSGFFFSGLLEGELLMLPPFLPVDSVLGSQHILSIPHDCALAGLNLTVQATTFTLGPLHLTLNNAIDFTIGGP